MKEKELFIFYANYPITENAKLYYEFLKGFPCSAKSF
jgi:hypothetical protein